MIHNLIFLLLSFLYIPINAHDSFIISANSQIIISEGDLETRHTPCSTFKIPLSLMGYDAQILSDEDHPAWERSPEGSAYASQIASPKMWMKQSLVWYSQILTPLLGQQTFRKYIAAFDYGNQNISGDPVVGDGLTHCWLSSSLLISPREQIEFLQKMVSNQLAVTDYAVTMTKNLLYEKEFSGWHLYGKTGTGNTVIDHESWNIGWYVGWLEKQNEFIFFAQFVQYQEKHDISAGKRAKEIILKKLSEILNNLPEN